jgi:hypothetical protein
MVAEGGLTHIASMGRLVTRSSTAYESDLRLVLVLLVDDW